MSEQDLGHGITYRSEFNADPIKQKLKLSGGECQLTYAEQVRLAEMLLRGTREGGITLLEVEEARCRFIAGLPADERPAWVADHRPEKPCDR